MPGRWLYGTLLSVGYIEVVGARYVLPDGRVLLDDVNFRVGEGSKAALVGANGAGKTTLLRLISGDLSPQAGSVARSGGLGVMRQFIGSVRDATTVQEFLVGLAPTPVREAWAAVEAAELALMDHDDERRQLDYAHALTHWGDVGGYDAEVLWDTVVVAALGMPFDRGKYREVATLSGGEQKRLAVEALLRGPDEVLLLDEPDNYLDVPGKRWLEDRLRETAKTVLFVSHDRELLAQVADRIVTVEGATVWVHGGGFASYHEARSAKHERMAELRRRWEEEHARLIELVRTLQQQAKVSDAMAAKYRVHGPPARAIRGSWTSARQADRAAGHDAAARRAYRRARGDLRGLGAHRAHAAVRRGDLLWRAGRRSRRERGRKVALPAAARRRAGGRVWGMAAGRAGRAGPIRPDPCPPRPGRPGRSSICSGMASRDEMGSIEDAPSARYAGMACSSRRTRPSVPCRVGSRPASRSCC